MLKVQPEGVLKLLGLNECKFAGTTLKIEHANSSGTGSAHQEESQASQTIEVLKNVLNRRYNSETKLLDLSNLGNDPELISLGMFNTTSTESKFFPALMKVCDRSFGTAQEKEEAILSVSLAKNALPDIRSVTTLASTLSAIRNLDLSENSFRNLGALEGWRWKFRKLEHIVLSGNPLETTEAEVKSDLLKWYPALRLINNAQVRTVEEVSALARDFLPLPVLGPSFRDEAGIAETFVKNFFPAYDSDRKALVGGYYDSQSKFSLSINTSAPRDETQQTSPWDNYIKRSRNLVKLNHTSAQMARLHTGHDSIADLFLSLPDTQHPDLNIEPHKWCIECHTIPGLPDPTGQSSGGVGGLLVTVHGEFLERGASAIQAQNPRSFDRTFVLGPGAGPGGIRVASDLLVLRAYGGHQTWKPENSDAGSANTVPTTATAEQRPAVIPDGFGVPVPGKTSEQVEKENLAIQLSGATGMTIDYSGLCLEQSGWNLEGAAAAFEQAKVGLLQGSIAAVAKPGTGELTTGGIYERVTIRHGR